MNFAYLAISSICNYKCKYCPCEKSKKDFMTLEEVKQYIEENAKKMNLNGIVLSGGEPTLNPEFLDILDFINKKDLYVDLFSNASKLADESFVLKIVKTINTNKLNVIITIFDVSRDFHDEGTGVRGSFANSLKAIKLLTDNNINVILKHCITKKNYKSLKDFFCYFDKKMPIDMLFQLTSLDYRGIIEKEINENVVTYKEIKPYLDEAFELLNPERKLTIVNTPLCASSSKNWKYFILNETVAYKGYKSNKQQKQNVSYDCDLYPKACEKCIVKFKCPGVYKKNYELLGEKLVSPIME